MRSGSPRRTAGLAAAAGLAAGVLALVFGPASEGAARERVANPVAPSPAQLSEPGHRVWIGALSLRDPRCVRADPERDRVFVIGTDGGFHVFHCDGRHILSRPLPLERDGSPQGIAVDADGNVLVADTHASRVLRLSPTGELLASYGRLGDAAGEFNWTTGVCEAPDRTLWVTEYGMQYDGDHDRLHHLRADGSPIAVFGGTGKTAGKFYRPSNVAIGPHGNVWVADACNNRLQVLDPAGRALRVIDGAGSSGGVLRIPYDLIFDGPDHLLVAEFGANRIRRFTLDGRNDETLVGPGRGRGAVFTPWGCATAPGLLLVADTGNHRLQAWTIGEGSD